MAKNSNKLTLDSVVDDISIDVDDAVDFMSTELEPEWELAEKYYQGNTRLEEYEGRSNVVKTEVRDAIRNTLPSIMRVLLQARKIVEYQPNSVMSAKWVEQQAEYVTQRFWACGGYMHLYNAILESAKLKSGAIKTVWAEEPLPRYFHYTGVTQDFVDELLEQPDVEIRELVESADDTTGVVLLDVEGYEHNEQGEIRFEAVPMYEFFISRNATSVDDAIARGIHGQRRTVSVAEAMEMGLEYDDWRSLDETDPEQSEHSRSSSERRGYEKRDDNTEIDLLKHKFTLTVAYVRYDLIGSGSPQLYEFWLGGTHHEYLDHREVADSPFELLNLNPIPYSAIGHSIADFTVNEQDTNTSVLRAIIDNAHAANNPRPAADPNKTNFDDLSNQRIGAPIRNRSGEPIQIVSIPFTGNGLLPVMQYLEQDVQNKVGVTKAAQGLDPDAMQSTDKNAVMNTIQTSQGQVELMVRNIVEGCLIPIFRKMLRLSLAHMPTMQLMKTKGTLIPVNISMFNPDLMAVPNVGLGTANALQKKAFLGQTFQIQQQFMQTMGMNNPFTSYTQMYNTLEDMAELDGITDVSRYYKMVTPGVEKKLAEAQKASAEQAKKEGPTDPAKALVAIEQMKQNTKKQEVMAGQVMDERKLALDALKHSDNVDLQRDKMVQDRALKAIELGAKAEEERIRQEQANNADEGNSTSTDTGGGDTKKSA